MGKAIHRLMVYDGHGYLKLNVKGFEDSSPNMIGADFNNFLRKANIMELAKSFSSSDIIGCYFIVNSAFKFFKGIATDQGVIVKVYPNDVFSCVVCYQYNINLQTDRFSIYEDGELIKQFHLMDLPSPKKFLEEITCL